MIIERCSVLTPLSQSQPPSHNMAAMAGRRVPSEKNSAQQKSS